MMIEAKELTYSYTSKQERSKLVLKGLDFQIDEGEIFGFLGPNGSGKSTTQKILTGLLQGYGGSVSIAGKEICEWDEKLYRQVGVLFEHPYLYSSLSGLDNLKYFASFYAREKVPDINHLLAMVELAPEHLRKPVRSYSKGMRQRLSLARVLLAAPNVLFLDEPTSGLDPAGAVLFREIIRQQKKQGVTVFLTTHNMFDADLLCDRVAFLAEGEIKALGSPTELKRGEDGTTVNRTLEDVFIQHTGRGLDG